ncbi:hypothetical protein JCM10450v2_006500 [Rhodotorula kratochvilovae]
MLVSLPLLAVAAATSVAAVAIPGNDVAKMKRDYISRLEERTRLNKRNSVTTGVDDVTVLNFALTLEHLEDKWYKMALEKFNETDFADAGYEGLYPLIEQISRDEDAHVGFLTAALKAAHATPVQACNYSLPLTSVQQFLAMSQIVEGLGVSAYLGAAGAIENPDYVTAAGSILTVETRHTAFVRFLNNYSPFPQPNDTPLSAQNVVSIVAPFFESCPEGSAPTIKAKPAVNVTSTTFTLGGTLEITPANLSQVPSDKTLYCGFASGLDAAFTTWNDGACPIPTENITIGQTYVVVTTGPSLADSYTVAGPAIIDTTPQNTTVSVPVLAGNSSGMSASSGAAATPASTPAAAAALASGETSGALSGKTAAGALGLVASLIAGLAILA